MSSSHGRQGKDVNRFNKRYWEQKLAASAALRQTGSILLRRPEYLRTEPALEQTGGWHSWFVEVTKPMFDGQVTLTGHDDAAVLRYLQKNHANKTMQHALVFPDNGEPMYYQMPLSSRGNGIGNTPLVIEGNRALVRSLDVGPHATDLYARVRGAEMLDWVDVPSALLHIGNHVVQQTIDLQTPVDLCESTIAAHTIL